jgi:phage shock protein A
MPQNSRNNAKSQIQQTKPQSQQAKPQSQQAKSQIQQTKPQSQQAKPQSQQAKPQSQQARQTTEQDGGLKFFDKMKNKYADWKTRRVIIKEAEAKADKAVALNKFNRLKSQYGFKGGDK